MTAEDSSVRKYVFGENSLQDATEFSRDGFESTYLTELGHGLPSVCIKAHYNGVSGQIDEGDATGDVLIKGIF